MSDLIAIGMRGFAAVCPADSPLRGARAVFGSQGLWVRGCRSARVPECATAGVRGCRSALVPECAGARVPECPNARGAPGRAGVRQLLVEVGCFRE